MVVKLGVKIAECTLKKYGNVRRVFVEKYLTNLLMK